MSLLNSYMTDKLEAWVPFDGLPGFEVKLLHLSRPEMQKLQKAATRITFIARQKTEELDSDMFVKAFAKNCILDWKGLTLEYAMKLLPILPPKNTDLTQEIPFSEEDAINLVKNSTTFDQWINGIVFDLDSFRK